MPSILLLLPSELKHRIAELSSRNSLASLARTHTAYQREAEQALYRTLSIRTRDDGSLKCLETLTTNSEKAGFVYFLTMECVRKENDENRRAMTYLLKALINMHSLSDFRLRMCRYEPEVGANLDKILCDAPFRLQTLYCEPFLDLSRIIRSQTELQILGIYGHCHEQSFLDPLKQLQNAQLNLPVVFAWEPRFSYSAFHKISIFPAFCSIDRLSTMHQVLANSLDNNQNFKYRVSDFFIYLVDSCDLPSIYTLTKNMSAMFTNISSITFYFEHRCEIPSQEMKKVISLFPDLHILTFSLWPGRNLNRKIHEDIKMAWVKDWELVSPKLFLVSFTDGSNLRKRGNEWS